MSYWAPGMNAGVGIGAKGVEVGFGVGLEVGAGVGMGVGAGTCMNIVVDVIW